MKAHIQKWGNSLALRIPRSFAEEVGVTAGSPVELTLLDGELVIRPVRRTHFTLSELMEGVSDENIHREVETGDPAGDEAW